MIGMLYTVIPDVDSIGYGLGVPYEAFLGHRGFTHSIVFAALLALAAVPFAPSGKWPLFWYLFLCAASHGVLDAFTDGGLGVAFFSPFSDQRFFFPWRPIAVSPIGVTGFFNHRTWLVLRSELLWVVAPSVALLLLGTLMRGVLWRGRESGAG
jgi:inner membrane protein